MGGPRGKSRSAILDAAGELFSERGFATTTVRDIAGAAGADPALVIRHFGSKERLFLESLHLPVDEVLAFEVPLSTLGERTVRYVLDTDHRIRATYLALVRASDSGEVGSVLRTFHDDAFVLPLRELLEGDDRDLRARLVASMIGGLMYSLWTVADAALAEAGTEAIVAAYAPALQRLITPG